MTRGFTRDASAPSSDARRSGSRLWLVVVTLGVAALGGCAWFFGAPTPNGEPRWQLMFGVSSAPAGPELKSEQLTLFINDKAFDVQSYWLRNFEARGQLLADATIAVHTTDAPLTCGTDPRSAGSFYCASDRIAHFDLGFYRALYTRCPSEADAAQTYVIAHTLAHHVQGALGLTARVGEVADVHKGQRHALGVRLDMQADCFAGVWARMSGKAEPLEPKNFEVAQRCASEVATDGPRKEPLGSESFTHGSAKQRAYWFSLGYASGRIQECDTFAPAQP